MQLILQTGGSPVTTLLAALPVHGCTDRHAHGSVVQQCGMREISAAVVTVPGTANTF